MGKLIGTMLLTALLLVQVGWVSTGPVLALAEETGWRVEFDAVCGQSENSMNMTVAELRGAIEKCDKLKVVIETLEPTPRKVYLKRLQMCRNLLGYMLENRLKAEQK